MEPIPRMARVTPPRYPGSFLADSVENDRVDRLVGLARHRLANDVSVDHVVSDLQLDRGARVGACDDQVVADQRRASDAGIADGHDGAVGTVAQGKNGVAA